MKDRNPMPHGRREKPEFDEAAIRRMRQRRDEGVKLWQIARMFGTSEGTVAKLTGGRNPRPVPARPGGEA